MYGSVVSSLTTFVAYRFDLMQSLSSHHIKLFQCFAGYYEVLYLAIPICFMAYAYASRFSAASIGESFARNIGLDFEKIVLLGVILVAIGSSAVVMIVGVIPFLGLIVPNIVALFMGDNMKRILPWTAYWGVIMVLVCDILGRLIIFPYEIPISLIISIFGGGVFIYLVLRDRAHG